MGNSLLQNMTYMTFRPLTGTEIVKKV